jgi:hypothetical protein
MRNRTRIIGIVALVAGALAATASAAAASQYVALGGSCSRRSEMHA